MRWTRPPGGNPSISQDDRRCPVVSIKWFDAIKFCNALSRKENTKPFYNLDGIDILGGNGYRLPTEAEWEYVCRAGTTTQWSFGDHESKLSEYAWYEENSNDMIHPVGEKQPNPWGLHDLHGNVYEWCWDWFYDGYYKTSAKNDPLGPEDGWGRVLRGGSFDIDARNLRSALRDSFHPASRFDNNGFRVARTDN